MGWNTARRPARRIVLLLRLLALQQTPPLGADGGVTPWTVPATPAAGSAVIGPKLWLSQSPSSPGARRSPSRSTPPPPPPPDPLARPARGAGGCRPGALGRSGSASR